MPNALKVVAYLCKLNENSIEKLHSRVNRSIELETALIFQKELNALHNILEKHPEISVRGLRVLLRQMLAGIGIPFYGEPLSGLQIMGVLETRTLDFDNLIMLSVNEGVLPSGKSSASFIPDDLKRHLEMPLHGEKDAIYAYHFYRLLQRAKNVSLIYNTETDTFGKGEKSRFITQLLAEWKKKNPQVEISERVLSLPVGSSQTEFNVHIKKTERVLQRLLEKAQSEKGLSPTALNTYKECELKFYFRFLANIREPDEVEEDIESSALGDIMHKSLEKLYTPLIGKNISATDIALMKKKADNVATESFSEYYNESADENGKKAIALHVIKKYLSNILDLEQELSTEFKHGISVNYLEKELNAELKLNTGATITIAGKADRIDLAGNTLRIVDYKSSVKKGYDKFNFTSLEEIFSDTKYSKALQLLIYAWLAWKNKLAPAETIFPCIIPFRAEEKVYGLTSGKTALHMSDEFFAEFEQELGEFISRIFDSKKDFNPIEDTGVCLLCAYQSICNRV
jgi:CRISPR/Cas system-associated exonuclease Cas4 (RecB family)